jgi:hypothetical protein
MSISGDYPSPVTVNGYSCKNCTEVDLAKKHIDPAHPKDGPYGINKTDAPGAAAASDGASLNSPAVKFGGALAGLSAQPPTAANPAPAFRLDISA